MFTIADLIARQSDGHTHTWTYVHGTTVDRGATYCTYCQKER